MKQREIYKPLLASILLAFVIVGATPFLNVIATPVFAVGNCADGIDNDGDGRIDLYGTASAEPDPSCLTAESTETKDDVKSTIIPCTDKCGLGDVFKLINNIISFVITTLLLPVIVLMIMYTGFQYLMARGNPGQHAKLLSLIKHIIGGVVLILCAWLIVRVLMTTLGYSDGLLFFD
ncbi:MAG TPA: pilin [Candidatus Paceibacterota bacterium]